MPSEPTIQDRLKAVWLYLDERMTPYAEIVDEVAHALDGLETEVALLKNRLAPSEPTGQTLRERIAERATVWITAAVDEVCAGADYDTTIARCSARLTAALADAQPEVEREPDAWLWTYPDGSREAVMYPVTARRFLAGHPTPKAEPLYRGRAPSGGEPACDRPHAMVITQEEVDEPHPNPEARDATLARGAALKRMLDARRKVQPTYYGSDAPELDPSVDEIIGDPNAEVGDG